MSIEEYITHLIVSPSGNSCVQAGEVLEVSHDQVTRLLSDQAYSGKDLYDRVIPHLKLIGGTLTVDDSVIDKPYSRLDTNDLVGHYWSGKHHRSVRGINLIALVYTDSEGSSLPVNFRLYNPNQDISKHELMQGMVREVIGWGLRPRRITADSWYASLANLKFWRGAELAFLVGVKSDRMVSTQPQ